MNPEISILIALVILSALFSGAETALMSVNIIKIKSLVKTNKQAALLLKLKEDSKRLIITILVGNNAINIGASAIATVVATQKFGSSGVGIATGAMTLTILIFGEIIPKNLALIHAQKIALFLAKPIYLLQLALFPVIVILEKITNICTRNISTTSPDTLFSEEELRTMVEVGVSENLLQQKERDLIEGALQFNDLTTADVMTPRIKIFSLQQDMTLADSYKLIIENNYSRIPIFKTDKDDISGIIYIKDILEVYAKGKQDSTTLKQIAKKPLNVHESEIINDVFRRFQQRRIHIAIVQDEHGGTAGLISLEDIIEEITGEIFDESDTEDLSIKRISKKEIIINGETEITDINQFFKINIPRPHQITTITGYLQHSLQTELKRNLELEEDDYIIKIIDINKDKTPTKISILKK
jgi:CBS domain containing-hemolysin-like protein